MTKKAFTLVELMVVVTVLSILASIGFVSYLGYSQDSRDGVRISNLNDIKKSLELKKSTSGGFPIPDNSYSVKYLGKEVWKQGIIGEKTKKHIKYSSIDMDPKYDTDYSYSVSSNGKRFEVGTIMEDEENNPMGFFLGNTYASTSDKALTFGNLKGKFHVTKVNGETHVFSIPSMIFNNSSDLDIVVDQPTTQFSVSGEGSLPEAYVGKSEANEEITFTPKLLYRGPNCGVETDQEIVNFLATLRDSFNYEPFLSNPEYIDIFNDYDTLRNSMDDFETLKKLGLKINKLLDCNIKSFKTVDIFPTQCGYEQLDFEGVENGFDIRTQSCLFTYTGNGNAMVKNGEGNIGSKGLHINFDNTNQTGILKYRVFTYKPVKFEYDIKTIDFQSGYRGESYIEFYINGFKYSHNGELNDYSSGFTKYSTELLPPGLYDFEWKVHRRFYDTGEVWLDNLNFTCVGGGPLCGMTGGFEPGNDDITFSGYVPMPWLKTNDNTEGIFAMVNPVLPQHASTSMTYSKTLTTPSRLSFDFKMLDTGTGEMRVYINGVESKFWSDRLPQGDDIEPNYKTYITQLLPIGEHTIEVKVTRQQHYTHRIYAYIDNFGIYCEESTAGCGMDMSFENSDIPFKGYFTFDGISTDPWPMEQTDLDSGLVNHGNFSMRNPMIPNSSSTYMYYHKDFDEPAKLSFDYNIRQSGSWAKFFIDDVEYKKVGYQTSETGGSWDTFTTPLLTGKHVIKIQVYKYTHTGSWGSNVYLYLDNFRLTCEGDLSLPSNALCGMDYSMEPSNQDLYTYGGTTIAPWFITTGSGGTQAIQNPKLKNGETSTVEFDYILGSNQEVVMDLDIWQGSSNRVYLYIDNILHKTWTSSQNMSDFTVYKTGILPAGIQSFKFVLDNKNTNYPITMKLDNIRVE